MKCPHCDHTTRVPWNHLGRIFACKACSHRLALRADGSVVEFMHSVDGRWVEAAKLAQAARLSRRRLIVAALVLVSGLSPAAAFGVWRTARPAPGVTEPELPAALNERAELFARAWLGNDVRLMKRLTSPAQDRAVYGWYQRHLPPAAIRGDGAAKEIEVSVQPGAAGRSTVRPVKISDAKAHPRGITGHTRSNVGRSRRRVAFRAAREVTGNADGRNAPLDTRHFSNATYPACSK